MPNRAAHKKYVQAEFLHLEYSVHQRLLEAWSVKGLPVVAVADGIVMGAGAGLWMASNIRWCLPQSCVP